MWSSFVQIPQKPDLRARQSPLAAPESLNDATYY
jgi:hypothetical protein